MPSHYDFVQSELKAAIDRPDFSAALPPLSDLGWSHILGIVPDPERHAKNERLEFLGDALISATIGRQLYLQLPRGNPHLYSTVRSALNSNATFSLLAKRADILAVSQQVLNALSAKQFGAGLNAPQGKSKSEVKVVADLFEVVVAAYYLESGFDALCQWVAGFYEPLIDIAYRAFLAKDEKRAKRPRTATAPDVATPGPPRKKARTARQVASSSRVFAKPVFAPRTNASGSVPQGKKTNKTATNTTLAQPKLELGDIHLLPPKPQPIIAPLPPRPTFREKTAASRKASSSTTVPPRPKSKLIIDLTISDEDDTSGDDYEEISALLFRKSFSLSPALHTNIPPADAATTSGSTSTAKEAPRAGMTGFAGDVFGSTLTKNSSSTKWIDSGLARSDSYCAESSGSDMDTSSDESAWAIEPGELIAMD